MADKKAVSMVDAMEVSTVEYLGIEEVVPMEEGMVG